MDRGLDYYCFNDDLYTVTWIADLRLRSLYFISIPTQQSFGGANPYLKLVYGTPRVVYDDMRERIEPE